MCDGYDEHLENALAHVCFHRPSYRGVLCLQAVNTPHLVKPDTNFDPSDNLYVVWGLT